jgi:two-component system sensor kinase FixL
VTRGPESGETWRRRAEEAEGRLAALLSATVDALVIIDERGHIEAFSPSAERMFGYSAAEVLGANVKVLMPSPYREEHDRYIRNYVETGVARIIGIGREAVARRRDGLEFPIELSVGKLAVEGRLKFVGILRDISARKRFEESMRRRERELTLMFDHAAAGIFTCAGDRRLRAANRALLRMLERTDEDLIGRHLDELVHPHDREALHALLDGLAVEDSDGAELELRLLDRDGAAVAVMLHAGVTTVTGEERLMVCHIIDRRGQLRAEQESREHRERLAHVGRISTMGEMASAIAHEVNQPLTAISAYARACQRMFASGVTDAAEYLEALDEVAEQAERAGEIIRRLRGFVNKGAGRTEPVDLNGTVAAIVEMVEFEARSRGITLRARFADPIPRIAGDAVQIQQVILNLVRNAIDAVTEAAIEDAVIAIETAADDRGDYVQVEVADNGPGLTEEARRQMFAPFFTTKAAGMGLGLSISHTIIEAHGGRIWCEDNAGGGTVFRISLPAGLPQE